MVLDDTIMLHGRFVEHELSKSAQGVPKLGGELDIGLNVMHSILISYSPILASDYNILAKYCLVRINMIVFIPNLFHVLFLFEYDLESREGINRLYIIHFLKMVER